MSIYPPVRNDLAHLLSQPRLAKYKAAVPGAKLDAALELYAWNLKAGGAFFESIHYLEVGLRNRMDEHLSRWAVNDLGASTPWYRDPAVPLDAESRRHVRTAIRRATDDGARPEVARGVIAELNFGFWWSLLAGTYNRSLWQPCLIHAFENARRAKLHSSLDQIRVLRNRIAHHEPIHARDLHSDYANLLSTAERISSRLAWWIDNTSAVPGCLQHRP